MYLLIAKSTKAIYSWEFIPILLLQPAEPAKMTTLMRENTGPYEIIDWIEKSKVVIDMDCHNPIP